MNEPKSSLSWTLYKDDGTWQRLHDTIRAQARRRAGRHKHPTAGSLDSQSVKTTQVPGIRGYGSGKHIKGRKRHILVDTLGLLFAVVVTAASVSDPTGARQLFKRLGGGYKKQEGYTLHHPFILTFSFTLDSHQ